MEKRAWLFSGVSILLFCLVILIAPCCGFGQDISAGIEWLKSNQNGDGSWGQGHEGLVLDYESSFQALSALFVAGDTGSDYQSALDWFRVNPSCGTAQLARELGVLASASNPTDASKISYLTDAFVSAQNPDGGFGAYTFCSSQSILSGLVLEALGVTDYSNTDKIRSAIDFLENGQDTSGGWTNVELDSAPGVFATSVVLLGVQPFADAFEIGQLVSDGAGWLGKHQNAGGGFGEDSSTVYQQDWGQRCLAFGTPA